MLMLMFRVVCSSALAQRRTIGWPSVSLNDSVNNTARSRATRGCPELRARSNRRSARSPTLSWTARLPRTRADSWADRWSRRSGAFMLLSLDVSRWSRGRKVTPLQGRPPDEMGQIPDRLGHCPSGASCRPPVPAKSTHRVAHDGVEDLPGTGRQSPPGQDVAGRYWWRRAAPFAPVELGRLASLGFLKRGAQRIWLIEARGKSPETAIDAQRSIIK